MKELQQQLSELASKVTLMQL